MRAPVFRGFSLLPGEAIADCFAGGGGTSTGIEPAVGRPPDVAINHSAAAIAMHKANHPDTRHYQEDIFEVDPREAMAGRPCGLAWFSPDCRHFSRAKGDVPLNKETRGLAWVVINWAKAVRPRIIMVENVAEFQTWGPLNDENRPDPLRAGETFRQWLGELKALGYEVDHRELVAADYGTPTTRRRLFVIARCDGAPIVWPEATHGDGRPLKWRPASDIIDWSLPCPSIFDRKRPLAPATLKRIATGIRRYVLEAADPFIIPLTHQGGDRGRGVGDPLATVTGAHRGELALVDPFLVRTAHGDVDRNGKRRGRGQHALGAPLPTVTGSNDFAICEPFVVRHGHVSTITGLGDTMRGQRLSKPLGTVCGTNDKHLVCPIVTKHYGERHPGENMNHPVSRTLGTVTARDHHALTMAFLTKFFGTSNAAPMQLPLPTVLGGGGRGGGHAAVTTAFLAKYYGAGGENNQTQRLDDEPLHTVTSKARFGLVMVRGEAYQIVDIGMRMLAPRELFNANGFPVDYDITPMFNGKPLTKTLQTSLAGNSVPPQVAEALIAANARYAPRMAA